MSSRTGHRPDLRAIGGFMESVLAMMVVICGVLLVTTSLSFVGIDLQRNSGATSLEDGCRSLSGQFFSLGEPFFDGEVLQNSSLKALNASLFHSAAQVKGYCVSLRDVTSGTATVVLLRTGAVPSENDTRSLTVPVLLSMADRTVHAAKATVTVWR